MNKGRYRLGCECGAVFSIDINEEPRPGKRPTMDDSTILPSLIDKLEKCQHDLRCLPSAAVLPICKRIDEVIGELRSHNL